MNRLRSIATLATAALVLAGCGSLRLPTARPAAAEAPRIPAGMTAYDCDGGKRLLVRYGADRKSAMIVLPEREFRLDGGPEGAGAKYTNGRTTFTLEGAEATLDEGGLAIFNRCKPLPASR